jgi:ribosomal protein L37AE/L43A
VDDVTRVSDCEKFGHDYSRSKTVAVDAFGVKKRRVYYCSFCGQERPSRKAREGA